MSSPNLLQSLILSGNCPLLIAIWRGNRWTVNVTIQHGPPWPLDCLGKKQSPFYPHQSGCDQNEELFLGILKQVYRKLARCIFNTVLKIKWNKRALVEFSQLQDQAQGECCSGGRSCPRQSSSSNPTTDAVTRQAAQSAHHSANQASGLYLGSWKMNYRDQNELPPSESSLGDY